MHNWVKYSMKTEFYRNMISSMITPARTFSVSGLKSKYHFWNENDGENLLFQIPLAPSENANLPGHSAVLGRLFSAWAAATLKGLFEFQNKNSIPLFTIIFKLKIIISIVQTLVHL